MFLREKLESLNERGNVRSRISKSKQLSLLHFEGRYEQITGK